MTHLTLQELLKQKGVSQRELAEILGMHASTVSLKITGKRRLTLREAVIIANRLNITTEDILCALNIAICKV